MKELIVVITVIIMSVVAISCGGGNPVTPIQRCYDGTFGLNDKGEIIVYPGDYTHILNYRCEDCHKVEHRENP